MAKVQRPTVKTDEFRGSFVNLVTPREVEKEDGSTKEEYSIFIPIKKDAKGKAKINEIVTMLMTASKEKHGPGMTPNTLKHFPIKDGDKMENEQFHGHWCINAKANFRPDVVDIHGNRLSQEEAYSGAWYKAKLSAWAWINKKGGKGVSVNVESALKTRDDEKFGGGSRAADDFAEDIQAGGGEADGVDNDDPLGMG